ncbi:unnamed protein product [Nesidiocoris tenuis]|uniref:Uncharacterized protein n=1 Tax=Nesidiocoris tenuis TaxID=355587 RepID=A0A6H5H6R6_9HEMI|nr:unnamed protein product [Nesidiocoris tenuis]
MKPILRRVLFIYHKRTISIADRVKICVIQKMNFIGELVSLTAAVPRLGGSEKCVKTFKESNELKKFKIGSVGLPQIAKNAKTQKSH